VVPRERGDHGGRPRWQLRDELCELVGGGTRREPSGSARAARRRRGQCCNDVGSARDVSGRAAIPGGRRVPRTARAGRRRRASGHPTDAGDIVAQPRPVLMTSGLPRRGRVTFADVVGLNYLTTDIDACMRDAVTRDAMGGVDRRPDRRRVHPGEHAARRATPGPAQLMIENEAPAVV